MRKISRAEENYTNLNFENAVTASEAMEVESELESRRRAEDADRAEGFAVRPEMTIDEAVEQVAEPHRSRLRALIDEARAKGHRLEKVVNSSREVEAAGTGSMTCDKCRRRRGKGSGECSTKGSDDCIDAAIELRRREQLSQGF